MNLKMLPTEWSHFSGLKFLRSLIVNSCRVEVYHCCYPSYILQWRHNERNGVSNHQPDDCLLKHWFRHRSKNTSKLRVTGLCEGNSPMTVEFPAQRASDAENVSIWWRHHKINYNKNGVAVTWWYHCEGDQSAIFLVGLQTLVTSGASFPNWTHSGDEVFFENKQMHCVVLLMMLAKYTLWSHWTLVQQSCFIDQLSGTLHETGSLWSRH